MKERNTRQFCLKDITFTVGDYRRRSNEFEKGLKYMLLIKVYDQTFGGKSEEHYSYRDTGYRGSTIRECREWARNNIARWV